MISSITIIGMVFTMMVCIGAPILSLAIMKIKKHAPIKLFLIGISMYLLFVMVIRQIFLFCMVFIFPQITENPALSIFFSLLGNALFEPMEFAIIAKVIGDSMNRGSKAVMVGLGHASAGAILSTGLNCFTYFTMAAYVEEVGVEGALSGLSGTDLTAVQGMINQLSGSPIPFFTMGIDQLCMMTMYACISVLIWMAVSERLDRKWVLIAVGMLTFQHLPVLLGEAGLMPVQGLATAIGVIVAVGIAVVTRKVYKKIEGNKWHNDTLPLRRLR